MKNDILIDKQLREIIFNQVRIVEILEPHLDNEKDVLVFTHVQDTIVRLERIMKLL